MMPKLSGFASDALPCERLVAPSGKFQSKDALLCGASSCARLNMSKAAKRNCSRDFSLSGNSLNSVMSHLLKPGVRNVGRSKSPNCPIVGRVTDAGLSQGTFTPVEFTPVRGLERNTGKTLSALLPY